jgi:alpha-1,2-mannosyltransferase
LFFHDQDDVFFIYPLPLAVVLLPLGLLPLEAAGIIWMGLSILAIILTIRFVLGWLHVQWPNSYFLPVVAGVFLFRPVAVTFYIHQIDAFILLCLASGVFLWKKGFWFWGGVLVSLTVLKPQVGAPLLIILGIWQILRGHLSALLGEGVTLLVLMVSGLAFDANWVGRWLSIGSDKVSVNYFSTPTVWGLSSFVCMPDLSCANILGTVLTIVISLLVLWIILSYRTREVDFVVGVVISGTLLISPYLWTYSQILLVIPILMITGALYHRKLPYLVTTTFPLLMALFSIGLVLIAELVGGDIMSSLVPITVWVLTLLIYHTDSTQPHLAK